MESGWGRAGGQRKDLGVNVPSVGFGSGQFPGNGGVGQFSVNGGVGG